MKSDRLDALQQMRNLSEGFEGGTAMSLISILIVLLVIIASLFWLFAAPIYLIRMNERLKSIERQIEKLLKNRGADGID